MKKSKKHFIITILSCLFMTFFISINAKAVTNPKVFDHKVNVPTNKVWSICLNDDLNEDLINSLGAYIKVTDANGRIQPVSIIYDSKNKSINVNPPEGGYKSNKIYSLLINEGLTNKTGSKLDCNTVIDFTTAKDRNSVIDTSLGNITYKDYPFTLSEFVDKQSGKSPKILRSYPYQGPASLLNVREFANVENIPYDNTQLYQFLKLNYVDGVTESALNSVLTGDGSISGKGKAFLEAGKKHNINPVYLVAHSILETGHGTSKLAKGVDYKTPDGKVVKVYNVYGIRAFDNDPINGGAGFAYKSGWTSVEKAIEGGAKWIADNYIHRINQPPQDTIYKMRWDIEHIDDPWHQYATDIGWAYKQGLYIEKILSQCNANLTFEIPRFLD